MDWIRLSQQVTVVFAVLIVILIPVLIAAALRWASARRTESSNQWRDDEGIGSDFRNHGDYNRRFMRAYHDDDLDQ